MARVNYVWFFFPPVPLGWRSPWGFSHVQQGQWQWPLDDGDLSSGFSDSLGLQQAIGSVYSGVVLNTHWWSTGPNIKDFVVAWNIGRTIKNHNQRYKQSQTNVTNSCRCSQAVELISIHFCPIIVAGWMTAVSVGLLGSICSPPGIDYVTFSSC